MVRKNAGKSPTQKPQESPEKKAEKKSQKVRKKEEKKDAKKPKKNSNSFCSATISGGNAASNQFGYDNRIMILVTVPLVMEFQKILTLEFQMSTPVFIPLFIAKIIIFIPVFVPNLIILPIPSFIQRFTPEFVAKPGFAWGSLS